MARLGPKASAAELVSALRTSSLPCRMLLSSACALVAAVSVVRAELSPALLELVRANLASSAAHSWEYGTRAEAELEYAYPSLSVCASSYASLY